MTIYQNRYIYPYLFIYNRIPHTLLWESNEKGDKFLTNNNTLYVADDIKNAKEKFSNLPFNIIWTDVAIIDFDLFWIKIRSLNTKEETNEKDCSLILNGWNFIEDILKAFFLKDLLEILSDPKLNKAYKKFFYGNNIEAVTPKECSYNPIWEDDEISIIQVNLSYVWNEIGKKTKLW